MNHFDIENIIKHKDFLNDFIKNKTYLYITTITEEYVDMTYNWFLSLKKINQDHLVLVGAIGENCYFQLKKLNINSVLIDKEINDNKTKSDWVENEKRIKTILPLYIGKKYRINFFHSDVDIFFNKNPFDYIKNFLDDDIDIFLMRDKRFDLFIPERKINVQTLISKDKKSIDYCPPTAQQLYGDEDAGFSFFNIKDNNIEKFLNCFEIFNDETFYDNKPKGIEAVNIQSITNKRFKQYNLNIKKLNCFDFVNGSIWKIPYLNEKIKNTFCMVHYNFCEPYDLAPIPLKNKKIKWMKENNHWLVD
jgi:hypothetical protein